MDKTYADTVRLLLTVAPDVFADGIFAMKGGTAINLFVQDMPRLSVDIDLAYVSWQNPRDTALEEIAGGLRQISDRLTGMGLEVRHARTTHQPESKLFVRNDLAQVKIEVNHVFRGTVLPTQHRPVCGEAATLFSVALNVPTLAPDELYGSKLVAAMDRQHPRDLFDVLQLEESGGLTPQMIECFVTYLAGHNRPIHEVLFPRPKELRAEFEAGFRGMTTEPVEVGTLVAVQDRLIRQLPAALTQRHRDFLAGLTQAEPDWSQLACPHASELPALRWKLMNLTDFRKRRPDEFSAQARETIRLLEMTA